MTAGDYPGVSGANMNALVEALDRRARQAGSEGATTVIRGMLSTITEVLSGLEGRLERIETQLEPADGADPAHELQMAVAGVHDRLGRLEDAFVQAVESSTEGADSMLAEIRTAVSEVLPTIVPAPATTEVDHSAITAVTELLDGIATRLDTLEAGVAKMVPDQSRPAETDARVLMAIEHLADVVRGLEDRLQRQSELFDLGAVESRLGTLAAEIEVMRSRGEPSASGDDRAVELIADLRRDLEAAHDRIDRGVGAVRSELDGLTPAPQDAATAMELRAVREQLDRLGRDEQAGRLVALVESRLSGAIDAIVKRAEGSLEAVRELRDDVDGHAARMAELVTAVDGLATAVESMGARVERGAAVAVEQMGGRVVERLAAEADQQSRDLSAIGDALRSDVATLATELAAAGERSAPPDAADRVVETVRREAEMLTQRVAALGKTIDAIRVEVEEQARRTEGSLGKKAGEIGRRLAADFGISTKPPDERRDPRELGRGT